MNTACNVAIAMTVVLISTFAIGCGAAAGTNAFAPVEPLAIHTVELPQAIVGEDYSTQLSATGSGDLSWLQTAGTSALPAGLMLSPSGLLSGQAQTAGEYELSLMVQDVYGKTASTTLTLVVADAPPPPPPALGVTGDCTIETIIGTSQGWGNGNTNCDNVSADSAAFSFPNQGAFDAYGNFWFPTYLGGVVVKVFAEDGVIDSTDMVAIASTGIGPRSVKIDKNGDVYICYNTEIVVARSGGGEVWPDRGSPPPAFQRVAGMGGTAALGTSGTIGEGGPATSATIGWVWDCAFDSANNMYFADNYKSVIRKVAAVGGVVSGSSIITTLTGTWGVEGTSGDGGPAASALTSAPTCLTIDSHDRLFFAGGGLLTVFDNRVRMIDLNTGTISTVAGSVGTYGHDGDGGLAVDATIGELWGIGVDSHDNLFLADYRSECNCVRRVNAAGGFVGPTSTIEKIAGVYGVFSGGYSGDGGPARDAELSGPKGIAFDAAGHLYISDGAYSHVIRRVRLP